MGNAEALRELEESLSRPSSTPCTWRADRDAYLEEMRTQLRKRVIDPIQVTAVASGWSQQFASQTPEVREMLAGAREGDTWLLLDPKSREFAKAFGGDAKAGPLSLLGFSSTDALAEWLG
jgi:hypothetical protein